MMKLAILLNAVLLATSNGASVNRHNINILSDISNQIQTDALSTKHTRNFVTITLKPKELIVLKAGNTTELTCEGIGSPAPSIHWFRNNVPIFEHDLESSEVTYSNPTSLGRVTSTLLVARTRDKDEYTCVISAKSKTARASTLIRTEDEASTILERLKLLPKRPHILVSYKAYVDVIGSKVVLPCKARGYPRPEIVWRNNKKNIIKNDNNFQVLRSGKLVISSLHWSDMGEYTCEATNQFGSQSITTFLYPAKAG